MDAMPVKRVDDDFQRREKKTEAKKTQKMRTFPSKFKIRKFSFLTLFSKSQNMDDHLTMTLPVS
jgi:hypothetical protein